MVITGYDISALVHAPGVQPYAAHLGSHTNNTLFMQVFSLPEFWDQRGECNVPTRAYGGHKAPIWDHEVGSLRSQ